MSNIKCAHCKGYHSSVQMVKNCMILSYKPLAEVKISEPSETRKSDHTPEWGQGAKEAAREGLTALLSAPAGRYALAEGVNNDDGLQIVKFYKIDRPTEGKWKGYTFLKHLVANGVDLAEYPIRNPEMKREILAAIAADVEGATALYGQELGCCGRCNRPLTDDESRARGIGPTCAARMGW